MKRLVGFYEKSRLPIRITYFGFLLLAFGFLIKNESVNVFYTFSSSFVLMLADGCNKLGEIIIMNLPLIFMLNLVCKKANSGVPLILALLGYFTYLITMSLFTSQSLPSYFYMNNGGIINLGSLNRYPLETGMIGSFIVAIITRFSFVYSRNRGGHSALGIFNRDTAALVINIVLCGFAGLLVAVVFPILYQYLYTLIVKIGVDLKDPRRLALYGLLDRTLSILGLNNFVRYPFWYTNLGGSYQTLSGQAVFGDVNIWPYVKNSVTTFTGCGRFITPYYIINMFIVPAIYIGILMCISDRNEQRRFIAPIVFGILLSIIAGNPLPLELLLFATSPSLLIMYLGIVAAVFGFLSYQNVYLGSNIVGFNTITALPGNFPDFIINLRNPMYIQNLLYIIEIGIAAAGATLACTLFYYRTLAFNFLSTGKNNRLIDATVNAVGGFDNIESVGSGLFRLNFVLNDLEAVSVSKLNELGAKRITETRNGISIEFGSSSYIVARSIRKSISDLQVGK